MKKKVEAFELLVEWLSDVTKVSIENDGISYKITVGELSVDMDGRSLEEAIELAYEVWNGSVRINHDHKSE